MAACIPAAGPQTLPYPLSPSCPGAWRHVPSRVPSHPGSPRLLSQDLEGDAEVGVLDTHGQGGGPLSPARPSFLHRFSQNDLGLSGKSS